MISLTICLILLCMLLFGCLAQGTGDVNDQWSKVSWTGMGCGLIIAIQAPNPWSAVLIGLVSMGMLWNPPMSVRFREKVGPGLVFAGAYVGGAPLMERWMVVPLLGMMGVVGSCIGLWAIYTSFQEVDKGYRHELLGGWLILADRDGGAPLAGQGNFNHAQALGALSAAACVGLLWVGERWAWLLLVLSLVGTLLCTEGRMTGKWMSQGLVHLGWLGMVGLGAWLWGDGAWIFFGVCVGIVLLIARPWRPRKNWVDSGRFALWNLALRGLWWRANQPADPLLALEAAARERAKMEAVQAEAARQENALLHNQMTVAKAQNAEQQRRWAVLARQREVGYLGLTKEEAQWAERLWAQRVRVRLLGMGTGSWYPLTKWPAMLATGWLNEAKGKWEGMVYTSAHNEYVELLFEQGTLGLLAGVALGAHALYWAWVGGAEGRALVFPLLVLASVCFTNFPFSIFAEMEKAQPEDEAVFTGSPALLIMSFLLVLMVEAVR